MLSPIINYFKPPVFDSFILTQKARFLHIALFISAVISTSLGVQNLSGDSGLDHSLFLLASISLLCIPLAKRGYIKLTSIFLSLLIFGVITFSLIDGVGLQDAALIAFPVFIIFTSFLINRFAALVTTFLSLGSVILVYYLDCIGYLEPAEYSNTSQLLVIIVLLIASGFIFWAVMDSWERITQNLIDTYNLTLVGWSKALELRDRETEGHSQRVVEMTIKLAKLIGVSGRDLDRIRQGALLHDIGKMAIPDAILLKPTSLTEDEWIVVKQHPTNAIDFLEDIPFLEPALDIPCCHHERWDGSGYPKGTAKEDIPLAARIFAIIDVWDALNSDRPYRKAWPREKVREYIIDQSGKHFDPRIVQEFLKLIDNEDNS